MPKGIWERVRGGNQLIFKFVILKMSVKMKFLTMIYEPLI